MNKLLYRLGRFFSIFGGYSSREDLQRVQVKRSSPPGIAKPDDRIDVPRKTPSPEPEA